MATLIGRTNSAASTKSRVKNIEPSNRGLMITLNGIPPALRAVSSLEWFSMPRLMTPESRINIGPSWSTIDGIVRIKYCRAMESGLPAFVKSSNFSKKSTRR